MGVQYFVDRVGKITNVRRTAIGGLLLDATLARAGTMEYGTTRRYNPPALLEQVAADTATCPVTRLHPERMVDVTNYAGLAAGHVVGTPAFRDGHIHATLAINDAKLIADIELGVMSEISMGYTAEHDGTAGVTEDGETYDEARVKIAWNHIAVVPAGRAGRSVRLMLDSEAIPSEDVMIKIGEVEVAVDSAQAAFDAYDARLQAQVAELAAARDALKVQLETAQAQLAVATSDEAIDAAVQARVEREAAAQAAAAKLKAVQDAYPTIPLDGRAPEFIDGLYLALQARKESDPDGLKAVTGEAQRDAGAPVVKPKAAPTKTLSAREKMRLENANAWRKPAPSGTESE